jgi:hypothetical protein
MRSSSSRVERSAASSCDEMVGVFETQVLEALAGRLYAREASDPRQEPLGAARLVEPEAVHEPRDRRRVEEQCCEHHTARQRDEGLALGQRLGKGERYPPRAGHPR